MMPSALNPDWSELCTPHINECRNALVIPRQFKVSKAGALTAEGAADALINAFSL